MTPAVLPSRGEAIYLLRAARWQFVPLGAAVGIASAVWIHARGGPMPLAVGLGLVTIALGAAFVLDDPAATTVESVPATARRRSGLRAVLAICVAVAAFGYLTAAAWAPFRSEVAAIELAGLLAIALAVGAVAAHVDRRNAAGIAGAGAVAAVLVADQLVFTRRALVSGGAGGADDTGWWLLVVVVAALIYVRATRDPAARGTLGGRCWVGVAPLPATELRRRLMSGWRASRRRQGYGSAGPGGRRCSQRENRRTTDVGGDRSAAQ